MPNEPSPTSGPLLLTPSQAALVAGVSVTRLRTLARLRKIEHVRIGGCNEIRFTHDQVKQAVELLVRQGIRNLPSSVPELDLIAANPEYANLRSLRAAKAT